MKNAIFSAVLLILIYLFIEAFSYAAYRVKFGPYSLYDLQHRKMEVVESLTKSVVFQPQAAIDSALSVKPILHPYVGYIVDGKNQTTDCESSNPYDCYQRIKVDTDQPLARRGENTLVVGVVGGSFADGTVRGGTKNIYAHFLRQIPQFNSKEIVVYNMTGGGMKQPQQLMSVNYYYALGGEFDIIINIDGFNEIAISFYGWRDAQLHPAFPASWNHRVSSGMDEEQLNLMAEKRSLRKSHAARAQFWLTEGIRHSPTMNLIWRLLDNHNLQALGDVQQRLDRAARQEDKPRDFLYESLGPDYQIENLDELNDYMVNLWANSSRALHALALGKGASYFHFIQPNQYIEGAKYLSEFEKRHAVIPTGGYGNTYKKAYPKLAEKGQELAAEGVAFTDLTHLFKDNSDDLYIDNCCHMNPKGYDLTTRAVVETIADHFKQTTATNQE